MRGCRHPFQSAAVKQTAKSPSAATAPPVAPAKPVIVVVDDDFAVRNSLAFALTEEGFLARVYASAEMLLSDEPLHDASCLVIDQKLPGLSGLDLIDELRRRDISAPVILITTGPSPQVRRAAAAAGVDIVEKPLISDALFQAVSRFVAPR